MNGFENFLLEDFEDIESVEKVIKIGGKSKTMMFRPISAALGDEIRKKCRKVTFTKGQKMYETDQDRYISNLIIETTVCPDLKNAELQKNWGVIGAEQLLESMKSKMLDGEYSTWGNIVSSVNGYDKGMEELMDDAKN